MSSSGTTEAADRNVLLLVDRAISDLAVVRMVPDGVTHDDLINDIDRLAEICRLLAVELDELREAGGHV